MGSYILIVGNVIDGLRFYGPFVTADEAAQFAQESAETKNDTWTIGELFPV